MFVGRACFQWWIIELYCKTSAKHLPAVSHPVLRDPPPIPNSLWHSKMVKFEIITDQISTFIRHYISLCYIIFSPTYFSTDVYIIPVALTQFRVMTIPYKFWRLYWLDTPHSVGPLWTSDKLDADIFIWQLVTLTKNKHPRPRPNSDPQSQKASGCRRPLRPRGRWDRPSDQNIMQ